MILEKLAKGEKFDFNYMRKIQSDVFDIQARDSLPDLLGHVKFIKDKALERFGKQALSDQVDEVIAALSNWDYQHTLESYESTLLHVWEKKMGTNFNSYKVRSYYTRQIISTVPIFDDFIYTGVRDWKDHSKATQPYCKMLEFADENQDLNCLYLLTYSLVQTIEHLNEAFSTKDITQWQLHKFQRVHYEH